MRVVHRVRMHAGVDRQVVRGPQLARAEDAEVVDPVDRDRLIRARLDGRARGSRRRAKPSSKPQTVVSGSWLWSWTCDLLHREVVGRRAARRAADRRRRPAGSAADRGTASARPGNRWSRRSCRRRGSCRRALRRTPASPRCRCRCWRSRRPVSTTHGLGEQVVPFPCRRRGGTHAARRRAACTSIRCSRRPMITSGRVVDDELRPVVDRRVLARARSASSSGSAVSFARMIQPWFCEGLFSHAWTSATIPEVEPQV